LVQTRCPSKLLIWYNSYFSQRDVLEKKGEKKKIWYKSGISKNEQKLHLFLIQNVVVFFSENIIA